MHIQGLNFVVVDDGTQAWAGKGKFAMGIFFLQQISVQARGEGVLTKIVQAK